jgi:hypothetical protein
MSQIFLDCPHCGALNVGMSIHARGLTRTNKAIAFAQCNRCTYPVTVLMQLVGFAPHHFVTQHQTDLVDGHGIRIEEVFPKRVVPSAP